MAKIMNLFTILIVQTLLFSNVFGQYRVQNIPYAPQIQNVPYSQAQTPSINTLLSTYATNIPIVDKLNAIAAVIEKIPPKNPGRPHKVICMAEALKKSALESLMFAANACKCSQKAESRIPLPTPQMTVGNDVIGNRAVNVIFEYV